MKEHMVNMYDLKSSQQYKDLILDVFKAFIEICTEHNLRYFCCGGTAIGAIRHQGMIPWDDDIDVLMPRPDYERLIVLLMRMKMEKYEIINATLDGTYYLPFAKLCNKHTSLVEYADIPSVFGAYIDIFPLDGAASCDVERRKLLQKFRRAANKLLIIPKASKDNFRGGIKRLLNFQLRTAFNEFFYAFNKRNARKRILNEIDAVMQHYAYDSAEFVGNYGGMWGIKEFGPKESGRLKDLKCGFRKGTMLY
jgi:lipopolysaccharide cholinephosphotransferase